jgi:sec-independent protein translocase protein TatA
MGLGVPELLIIGFIAILLFGSGRIAGLGKGLGQGIRQFKRGLRHDDPVEAQALPVLTSDNFRAELPQGMTRHASSHHS